MNKTLVIFKIMRFYNDTGSKTEDDVLAIIDDHINAYNALKKVGIENCILENGNVSCVDVIAELKTLKTIVSTFANDGEYNNDSVCKKHGFDLDRLFGIEIKTYDNLNKAIFDRIKFLKTALYKQVTKTEYVEKSTTKSIDKNTFFTSVIATFAIGSAFLIEVFSPIMNFSAGILVCVIALNMICYKKTFFEDIE